MSMAIICLLLCTLIRFIIPTLSHATHVEHESLLNGQSLNVISRSCRPEPAVNASIYYRIYTNLLDEMSKDMEFNKFSMRMAASGINELYVMSQCMDYLTNERCNRCFMQGSTFLSSCLSRMGGRVYMDGCFIRAEIYDFFGEAVGPGDNVSCDSAPAESSSFGSTVTKLTDVLVKKASKDKFAIGNGFSDSAHVYGAAICWKSLELKDCTLCLELAARSSESCLPRKEAQATFTGCIVRYADYKFTDGVESPLISGSILIYLACLLFALLVSLSAVGIGCCLGKYTYARNNLNSEAKAKEVAILKNGFNFKYPALEKATQNFSEDQKLGQGGYGEVYKGTLPDGREIAVKRLFTVPKSENELVFNEMDIISQAQHKSLVHFLGCCFTSTDIFLIYEFLPNRSLDLILFDSKKKKELDWKKRIGIITGTAQGLEYLHEDCQVRIIHRDIKASNILLDLKYKPKISDFGLAQFYSSDKGLKSTAIAGTLGYMAPEYLAQGQLTEKVDVYSFGVLVLEIISGERNNEPKSEETFDTIVTKMWRHYGSNSIETLIDESLGNEDFEEIKRVAQIGLLCTQESQYVRPTIALVVQMLTKGDIVLPKPTKPPFTDESLEFTSLSNRNTLNIFGVKDI